MKKCINLDSCRSATLKPHCTKRKKGEPYKFDNLVISAKASNMFVAIKGTAPAIYFLLKMGRSQGSKYDLMPTG